MNPDVKARWLSALRSGDYQQGTGSLRLTQYGAEEWCCLGVLCDIAAGDDVGHWTGIETANVRYQAGEEERTAALPTAVMKWASLSEDDPDVTAANPNIDPSPQLPYALSAVNDEFSFDFMAIADLIERDL